MSHLSDDSLAGSTDCRSAIGHGLTPVVSVADSVQGLRVVPDLPPVPHKKTADITLFSQVADQTVEWLWPDRVPLGKLTLLVGDPGLGKSFVTVDWAARVSRGGCWPGEPAYFAPHGKVILLNAEDDPSDTTLQRLKAAGADLSNVAALTTVRDAGETRGRLFSLRRDLDTLETAIANMPDCRLVIVDPISAYMDGVDSNRNIDVRSALHPLTEMAAAHRVAVVAVTHLNKNVSRQAIYRTLGSLAFVAQARSVWGVVRDPTDSARRMLIPVKTNISNESRGLVFRLPDAQTGLMPRVEWQMMVDELSLETALAQRPARHFNLKEQEYRNAENYCAVWLHEQLVDGPLSRNLLGRRVRDFTDGQLHRASLQLGVLKFKEAFDGGWIWMLPEHYDKWVKDRNDFKRRLRRAERKEEKQRRLRSAKMKAIHAAKAAAKATAATGEESTAKSARNVVKRRKSSRKWKKREEMDEISQQVREAFASIGYS